jgi:hypothetical protein
VPAATYFLLKEADMARKKGKSVSFDAMIKFFMQYYNVPTRKDIDKLMAKMDRLEVLIKTSGAAARAGRDFSGKTTRGKARTHKTATTSADMVLDVIKRFKKGVGFSDIQARTGFGEKKLRNIIFRLHKMGKIVRISRGIYIAS